jgi:hypothetical protein
MLAEYTRHPDFNPSYPILADVRGITQIDSHYLDMYRSMLSNLSVLRKFAPQSSCAILVTRDEVYGMMRMAEQIIATISNLTLHVTRDETRALELCNRDEEAIAQLHMNGRQKFHDCCPRSA